MGRSIARSVRWEFEEEHLAVRLGGEKGRSARGGATVGSAFRRFHLRGSAEGCDGKLSEISTVRSVATTIAEASQVA